MGFDPSHQRPRTNPTRVYHPSRTTKLNPTTNQPEPYVPFSIRLPRRFLSFTFVIFGLLIIAGAFIAIIIYRLAAEIMLANAYANDDEISEVNKKLTASIISLCTFLPLNALFTISARKITALELSRTQEEYNNSLSLKVFCFQFVNFYSPLFYIAFFKDTLAGHSC